EDLVAIRNQGSGAGQIGVSGTHITYGGTIIGRCSAAPGATLPAPLNAAATVASSDALIQNLTYASTSEAPTPSRALVLNVTDADGADLGPPVSAQTLAPLDDLANPLTGNTAVSKSSPTFGDLDGDGDMDAVVGNGNGQLQTLRNDGGVFTVLIGAGNPLNGMGVVWAAAPTVFDFDGDGDPDLVVGNFDGQLRTFENIGGGFIELTRTANPFAGVDADLSSC